MTKYKAFLRLAERPYKIIRWFTKNWDKEIGALGIGEMKDGELFVERLLFPKQIVNGAHVHFKPEDWKDIVLNTTDEEFSKIIFYWHKHPDNMPSASQGDEDDTFDVFMPEDTDRNFFGFMQTSATRSGGMDYEARIEMRNPLFASITDVELITNEDDAVAEECKKIVDDYITKGNASASDQPGATTETGDDEKGKTTTVSFPKDTEDNDIASAIFEVRKKHGQIMVKISDFLEPWIDQLLEDDVLSILIKDTETEITEDNVFTKVINPKKKKGKEIYKYFKAMENELCEKTTMDTLENAVGVDNYDKEKVEEETKTQQWRQYGNGRWGYFS